MVAVESLYLVALLSAFIGLIALFALARRDAGTPIVKAKGFLTQLVVFAAVVSVGSFLLYSFAPHQTARSVYRAEAPAAARL